VSKIASLLKYIPLHVVTCHFKVFHLQVQKIPNLPLQPKYLVSVESKLYSSVQSTYLGYGPLWHLDFYQHTCNITFNETETHKLSRDLIDFENPWTQFADVLLVVVFNTNQYSAIPYFHLLYNPFFTQIIYCGPDALTNSTLHVPFIQYQHVHGHERGAFNYECVIRAMEMYPNVSGYLQTGDDVFFLFHNMSIFPQDKVWYMPLAEAEIADFVKQQYCNNDMCKGKCTWVWYQKYKKHLTHIWNDFKNSSSTTRKQCYQRLVASTKGDYRTFGKVQADFYYIPVQIRNDVMEILRMFLHHKLFLEMAIVDALACSVDDPNKWMNLSGAWVFDPKIRNKPRKYFAATNAQNELTPQSHLLDFYHPVKWGYF
jgi:hypothetical protein